MWIFKFVDTHYFVALEILWIRKFVSTQNVHYENMSVQYEAISKSEKNDIFICKNAIYYFYFCSKHRLWVHVRTASLRQF